MAPPGLRVSREGKWGRRCCSPCGDGQQAPSLLQTHARNNNKPWEATTALFCRLDEDDTKHSAESWWCFFGSAKGGEGPHLFGSEDERSGSVGDARSVTGRYKTVLLEHGLGKWEFRSVNRQLLRGLERYKARWSNIKAWRIEGCF
jgi:hypothetical protein